MNWWDDCWEILFPAPHCLAFCVPSSFHQPRWGAFSAAAAAAAVAAAVRCRRKQFQGLACHQMEAKE